MLAAVNVKGSAKVLFPYYKVGPLTERPLEASAEPLYPFDRGVVAWFAEADDRIVLIQGPLDPLLRMTNEKELVLFDEGGRVKPEVGLV